MPRDLAQVLEELGAENIRKVSETSYLNPAILDGIFSDISAILMQQAENVMFMDTSEKIPLGEVYHAEYGGVPMQFTICPKEWGKGNDLLLAGYDGKTTHPTFFSPFYQPYAMVASFNNLIYSMYAFPFTPILGGDSPGLAPEPLIVPLVTTGSAETIREEANQKGMPPADVVYGWLLARGIKNQDLGFPVPTIEQITLTKKIFDFAYRVQEARYK